MRRRSREIQIFNLSMLDVISGALGAFLFLVAILLPFYQKDLAVEIRQLQDTIREQQEEIEEIEAERQAAEEQVEELEDRLNNTFLLVLMKWKAEAIDVDLHLVDPSGAEFYWGKTIIAGRPGELTEDDTSGPGNEIWSIPEAPEGEYRVYYNLFDRHGNREHPQITGRVFFRAGSQELPDMTLNREQANILVATISVDGEGRVRIR